jgi:hypothetical protein
MHAFFIEEWLDVAMAALNADDRHREVSIGPQDLWE